MELHTPELRAFCPADLPSLVELTCEVFGPFYEDSFRGIVGERVFQHQHGSWRADYAREVPELCSPEATVVAEDEHGIVGYVAWSVDAARHHGQVTIIGVRAAVRRSGLGRRLLHTAFGAMREQGVEVVAIGTGGDPFHAPARALYESAGCIGVPAAYYFKEL